MAQGGRAVSRVWGFPTVGTGDIMSRMEPGVALETSPGKRDPMTYNGGIAPLGLLEERAGAHHRDGHVVGTKACPHYGEDAQEGQGPARDMQVTPENAASPAAACSTDL